MESFKKLKVKKPVPEAHSKTEGVIPEVRDRMEKALHSKRRFGKLLDKMRK